MAAGPQLPPGAQKADLTFKCPQCQQEVNMDLGYAKGTPVVTLPTSYCVECDFREMPLVKAEKKGDASRIVKPAFIPPTSGRPS